MPRKPRYLRASCRPTSWICLLDAGDEDLQQVLPARTLRSLDNLCVIEHRADDQHEHQRPGEDDGRVELENPYCQKMISSGVRRMAGLRSRRPGRRRGGRSARSRRNARDQAEQAGQQALPMAAATPDRTRPAQTHPQQQAAEQPQRRARRTPGPCAPSTTARRRRSRPSTRPARTASTRARRVIHRDPPAPRASPGLPWRPNARR